MHPYTEQDIQDYLDGNFQGDARAFENYIQQNSEAQQLMRYYRLLYKGLEQEAEMGLSFNLQDAVVAKTLHKKEKHSPAYRLLNALTALTAVAVIIFCWNAFEIGSMFNNIEPMYVLLLPLLGAFMLAWHSIELAARKKKYQF